ncbi:MAG: hypothetical protein ACXWW5_02900 [Actinomycetota bacterium]
MTARPLRARPSMSDGLPGSWIDQLTACASSDEATSLNAIATLMLVLSLAAIGLAALVMTSVGRKHGGADAAATRQLLRFEL